MARSVLGCAIATGLLLAASLPVAAQEYQEPGRIGDADSWRTDEFMADWGLGAIGAEYAYARGLTGQGINLGLFDSGAALDHSELAGRGHHAIVLADPGCSNVFDLTGCFYSDGGAASIEGYLAPEGYTWLGSGNELDLYYNAHGTHVAGTMAASRNGDGGMHGVAFGATLSSAQLFTHRLNAYFFDQLGMLDYEIYGTSPSDAVILDMYQQMAGQGVRAINHSWGFTIQLNTAADMDWVYGAIGGSDFFQVYADGSLNTGMIQVWAAGNGGDDGVAGNGTGYYAGLTATLPRWMPELEPYWLSVANLSWDGELDESSNVCGLSMDWCITAPGTDIASSVVDGPISGQVVFNEDGSVRLEITGEEMEHGYAYYTGTSMAAPHVTGALALLMERYPYLDNTQVRDVMLTTAYDLGAAGIDEIYGWGLLDLAKAINGPGQIRVDTDVVMNQRAGGTKVWEGNAWDDWSNDIGGPGRLTKSGIGWLRLSGDNSFGGLTVNDGILELTGDNSLGDTVVDGGLLLVNGVHSDRLRVNAGGMLGGSGTLGDTAVAGTVSPGNSIGTLSVAGDYHQLAGSSYDAELGADGTSDLIAVAGNAYLDGGTVRLLGTGGQYLPGQSYALLTAGGLIEGAFAGIDSSAFSPFLGFALDAGAGAIGIDVVRGMAMADAAQTRNQRAVATSADAMAVGDPLFAPLVQLFPAQAVEAFDALSGEYHPGTRALLVEGSRHVRDAALDRALPLASAGGRGDGVEAWVQGFGAGTSLDGDGNAAAVDGHGTGTLLGADLAFGAGWRIGAFGGVESTDVNLAGRASRGDVHSRHLGVYLGRRQDGGIDLGAGASYARHEVDSERSVAFPGVEQYLSGEYDADILQVFAEGAYRIERDGWDLQPYARYAHVQVESDGFGETGGSAALTAAGAESRVNLFTAGVRVDVAVGGGSEAGDGLVWRSGLAYRHASGDLDSRSRMAWAGGQPFTVAGAPVADGAALLETGLAGRLAAGTLLELNYQGQFADGTDSHGLVARLSFRF